MDPATFQNGLGFHMHFSLLGKILWLPLKLAADARDSCRHLPEGTAGNNILNCPSAFVSRQRRPVNLKNELQVAIMGEKKANWLEGR